MQFFEVALLGRPLTLTYRSEKKLHIGDIVEVPVKSKIYKGAILQQVDKPSFECAEIEHSTSYYFSHEQLKLAQFIATYYVCHISEALQLFHPFDKETVYEKSDIDVKDIVLSKKQQEALQFAKDKGISLLFGDTGSGKTQVYLAWMKEVVQSGKEAIFLMPEIALTPQMLKRIEAVFGDSVALWHSRLSKKKREETLQRIRKGEIKVIAGPRSALFLPLKNLGLIVVDEEHDDSYKSQSKPRIHARDIAVYMGKTFDIPVLLGSATPSVSSSKRYPSFRLKGSYFGGQKHFIFDSSQGVSTQLLSELQKVLEQKKQALIFLPTRAHFKYLICQECGEAVKCPYCDVGMSVHFDEHALECHYCNFKEYIPKQCPSCGSSELSTKRLGTAQIQSELQLHFPSARIERFDKDAVSTQRKLEKLIKEFSQKKIDILVGTQMLSKGHDYPDVALSVVMDIDYVLAMADYRARERAVSLFVQIAGRAGRKESANVVVQTKNEAFFDKYKEYDLFLQDELAFRKDLYPPFTRLAQLNFAHKNESKAKEAMEQVLTCLRGCEKIEIVGYGPNAIEKIAGKYRYHILLRSPSSKALLQAIYACKNDLCDVDMDPVQIG
ncbi:MULTISPECIES: primosomal protein N' [unclassified Nitratiruptor]|uniref:primosomal protein N' n=1 Tax=unclassified Nitratiruptor TaxID=2624044 RepID=UPI0019168738|nr:MULTISPECIES: primosomal protein N' [unclassified Nitratiruptor]BCD59669.1 primosomal protein N' [Nitratiruptor sp. YY08-10]BCD63593.1 primosomal protein N' [Nitratiruptor sp. YY08-14]